MISGKTKICGLIGDPVEHSMSPAMHNAAFEKLALDYAYLPFRVKKDDLGRAIHGMRALDIRGLNVTIPHKLAVMPFLDKLDALAGKIGAVNTIVNDSGILTGYNTDAEGFVQPLVKGGIDLRAKRVAVVGAGGAARGIAFALAGEVKSLVILNRSADRAEQLARQLREAFGPKIESSPLNQSSLGEALRHADLLVNTTSVGMTPGTNETPIPAALLRPGLVVYDIVYNPAKTRLLDEAERAGAITISGIDMLAYQGAAAFEKWTGHRAPVDVMRREAVRHLAQTRDS